MKNIAIKLVKLLIKKKLFISFAESCTGGLLSSNITSISGCSKVFKLGLITYSNISKEKILKVPKRVLNRHGAVSKETCNYMLKNLFKLSKTDLCVAITGIAGPRGGSRDKPVGLVFIGYKFKDFTLIKKYNFKNLNRSSFQKRCVKVVFSYLISLIK